MILALSVPGNRPETTGGLDKPIEVLYIANQFLL